MLTHSHPGLLLWDAGNSQVGVGMGCSPGRTLERQMGSVLSFSLHLTSNYPFQTVLNWDILLQLFSLISVALLHSFLIGYQRGQSPQDRNQVW